MLAHFILYGKYSVNFVISLVPQVRSPLLHCSLRTMVTYPLSPILIVSFHKFMQVTCIK